MLRNQLADELDLAGGDDLAAVAQAAITGNQLHIIEGDQRASNHSKTEASVRQAVTVDSETAATGPARSRAWRFVSRSIAAYRLVVSTLACPSQWLMVTRSTPA